MLRIPKFLVNLTSLLWVPIETPSHAEGARSAERPSNRRVPGPASGRPGNVPDADDTKQLVRYMLAQSRYALLLRPQIAENLAPEQLAVAQAALDEGMSLTPEGVVLMRGCCDGEDDDGLVNGRLVRVEPVFVDRCCVTNAEYQQFVAAGGYEQMSLWSPEVWPAVVDFVDETGMPGPKHWRDGVYPKGQEDHPVTGVCWFEAEAYSRWVGKRLPTDSEWVKAGVWPVSVGSDLPQQRRFPWGETMDRSRVNLWGSEPQGTVPVRHFEEGVSVGGIYQLIGNVWEWTNTAFGAWDGNAKLEGTVGMMSLRGGAFDTYFDSQANCHFQSGDVPLARKHNIGFRCAVGICDLAVNCL